MKLPGGQANDTVILVFTGSVFSMRQFVNPIFVLVSFGVRLKYTQDLDMICLIILVADFYTNLLLGVQSIYIQLAGWLIKCVL